MQSTVKSKAPPSQPARLSNGYGPKNTMSTQRHSEGRVDSMRKEAFLNRERVVSRDNERMHSIARNGSNQASTSKTTIQKLPSRGPIANKQPSKDLNDATLRKSSVASKHHLSEIDRPKSSQSQRVQSAGQRPQHSSHGQRPHQSMQHRPQQSLQSRRPQQMTQGQKPQQSLQTVRTQQSLQNQRPQQSSHIQKSQSSQTHRPQSLSNRSQPSQGQRPLSSKGQYSEQRRVQANDRVKQAERQIRPPSKSMVNTYEKILPFCCLPFCLKLFATHISCIWVEFVWLGLLMFHLFHCCLFICACSHLGQSLPMEFVMIMQRESKWQKEDLMKMKMRKTPLQ